MVCAGEEGWVWEETESVGNRRGIGKRPQRVPNPESQGRGEGGQGLQRQVHANWKQKARAAKVTRKGGGQSFVDMMENAAWMVRDSE